MAHPYTWRQLAGLTLARQFPSVRGRDVAAVVETLHRVGPLQTQTARSAFLGLAARLPGVTPETVTAAYEQAAVVRGSSLRGTVHTSVAGQHPLLEATTRLGQRRLWERVVKPQATTLEQLWAGIEDFATAEWRTPAELADHLAAWLAHHEPAAAGMVETTQGRFMSFGHGGLLRRPLRGGWEGQGAPGYRAARAVLADAGERHRLLAVPDTVVEEVVRLHVTSYGPASRHDIAWWSGLGLRRVDAALEALAPGLTVRPGPDGRDYWDLADGMPRASSDVGTRLLPEFDATMVGYDPRARDRFVDPEHHAVLWSAANGLLLPPVLHRGRLVGYWRIEGTGRTRRLSVRCFAGCPRPTEDDLAGPAAQVTEVLGGALADVTIGQHAR